MSGSAARSRRARWRSRSCSRGRDPGLRCDRRTRCRSRRCHSRLRCCRWMCNCWRYPRSRRPGRASRNTSRPHRGTGRSRPGSGRLSSNSGSNRSDGLRCCGSRRRASRAHRWSRLCSLRPGFFLRLHSRFGCRESLEMLPHEFGVVQVERARVRLLFGDADFRQIIDQDFCLDLEFPCQLVDADLIWI